jgi:DNA polymerase III gamma/tau subunit
VDLLVAGQASAIPKYFEDLEQAGIDFSVFNRNFLEYLRGLLVFKVTGVASSEYLAEESAIMEKQVEQVAPTQIIHWLRLFLRSFKDLAIAPEPSLALLLASMEAVLKNEPLHVRTVPPILAPAKAGPAKASPAKEKQEVIQEAIQEVIQEVIVEEEVILDPSVDPYTLEEVQGFWPQVLDRLKMINSPLAMLVKNSPITKVSGAEIFLSVKYLFHKEHLESKKINSLLLSTISELGGRPSRLRIEINSATAGDEPTGVDAISEVLRVFGGELVE